MEDKTKAFIKKVKFDIYIYTLTFMVVAVSYGLKHSTGIEPFILLLAAFAFYTIGRQVSSIQALEEGETLDNKPKAPPWVRGITYITIIILVLGVMFSF